MFELFLKLVVREFEFVCIIVEYMIFYWVVNLLWKGSFRKSIEMMLLVLYGMNCNIFWFLWIVIFLVIWLLFCMNDKVF